ncbi:MAG: hypothetical protein OEZ39_19275 [Gammaproteobacteria bacterium]|nr:hypothetical protein [Gammaproteobacteria bacterium]MDH5654008.1 hypothetical protein [Gammaproteobacteria bacterium]
MGNRNHHNEKQMRILLAQAAARILVESGSQDFLTAKRKAALHLGAVDTRNMPSNAEIEQALIEYQRIFRADTQPVFLKNLRLEAIRAMEFFNPFRPRLVGPVLHGTADEHTPITLHLFARTSEEVGLFLMDYHVPYKLHDKRLRLGNDRQQEFPSYRFMAGQIQIEAVIFPSEKPTAPLSPVDGRPMRRAGIAEIEQLLEEFQVPSCG